MPMIWINITSNFVYNVYIPLEYHHLWEELKHFFVVDQEGIVQNSHYHKNHFLLKLGQNVSIMRCKLQQKLPSD